VVAHLERLAQEDGIELMPNTSVTRIDRDRGCRRRTTSHGDLTASHVVVDTGYHHTPVVPQWPGTFDGAVTHSSSYRNPAAYAGKKVLDVGSGSSGMEIAHDLGTGCVEMVWLSVHAVVLRMVRDSTPMPSTAPPAITQPRRAGRSPRGTDPCRHTDRARPEPGRGATVLSRSGQPTVVDRLLARQSRVLARRICHAAA
jgi:cation diffusion facilitator CzcD-associated flavoprotein CzcO